MQYQRGEVLTGGGTWYKISNHTDPMMPVRSSPEIADELLEIVSPAANLSLALGTNLNIKFEIKQNWSGNQALTSILPLVLQDPQM